MPNLPGVPISAVPPTSAPNADLPSTAFPSLLRIAATELVGPPVANRQHKSLEKRDETLRAVVNLLVAAVNAVDTDFLRRDGTTQQDSTAGILGNMPMNGFRFTGMASSTTNGHAVEHSQLTAEAAARSAADSAEAASRISGDAGLQSQVNLKAPLNSPALTGVPTAPTAAPGTNNTQVATTAYADAAAASAGVDIGGSGVDGVFNDSSPAPTVPGYYDYTSFTRTTPVTFPCGSIVRVRGNFTLSSTLTVGKVTSASDLAHLVDMGAAFGNNGSLTPNPSTPAGGGSIGAGSNAAAGAARPIATDIHNWWTTKTLFIGGSAQSSASSVVYGTRPGGGIIIIVDGDADLTGGTIASNGEAGNDSIPSRPGGTGAGSIILACLGTQTGGTLSCHGGDGNDSGAVKYGAGGGGLVIRAASAFAGSRTNTVTGGAASGSVAAGGAGYAVELTYTAAQIRAALTR